MWLRIEVVHECPQTTSNLITSDGIADLTADRVGHFNRRFLVG
jgi:hypothetical protein